MPSPNNQQETPSEEKKWKPNKPFFRFLRFGSIDTSLLILSMIAGVSVDTFIARRIGVHGYGPLFGACVGNIISDGVAALPEGRWASVGAMVGATLPVVPPMVCMFTKTPLVGRVKYIVGCSSLVFLAAAFTMGRVLKIDNEENN